MNFTAIDLFAGIGGFRIAVERCGGNCIAFSEIDKDAIETYISNYADTAETNLGDITVIRRLPQVDLLTAGVPCQSWSIAGRNLGFDDDRGMLWNDVLFLLNQSKPKAFIFENVKGLADPRNRQALEYIHSRIAEAGYYSMQYILNSCDYGATQSRVRIYIIGFREECHFNTFIPPKPSKSKLKLFDIIDDVIVHIPNHTKKTRNNNNVHYICTSLPSFTSLSTNNNGFNDYFLFNDIRNGSTTIHSWDILPTTQRQKEICLLLLRNRRKKGFGFLDGNPLSLAQFKTLDSTITKNELDELVTLGILKTENYLYAILDNIQHKTDLSEAARLILSKNQSGVIVPDRLVCDSEIKKNRVKILETLDSLEENGLVQCVETRYEFRNTKISTGLNGVCRIFLPSSNVFPTLVASDTNDYLTPILIHAENAENYKKEFIDKVFLPKQFRKISKLEACRIQGFPDTFILPESRSRWMKLLGNSVSVPLVQKLVQAIVNTGVFGTEQIRKPTQQKSVASLRTSLTMRQSDQAYEPLRFLN